MVVDCIEQVPEKVWVFDISMNSHFNLDLVSKTRITASWIYAWYLEHALSEELLVLLSPPPEDDVAEVREVDEAVLGDSVAQVHDVLLHGVQSQHLHGGQQVLC